MTPPPSASSWRSPGPRSRTPPTGELPTGREARLTSTRNPRVQAVARLHDRAERERTGRYLVEGQRALVEVAAAGAVDEVFATPDEADRVPASCADRLTLVDAHVLRRMSDSVTPQGVVAVARREPARLADVLTGGLLVVLDGVADPGNVGTIVRTVTAAGAAGVALTPGSVDPWNPKAVRASAGAVARVRIVVDVALADIVSAARAADYRVVATAADGRMRYDAVNALEPPVTIVFGSEARGLDAVTLADADRVISIPHYGPVESLNLAAAVAVVAFEAARAAAGRHAEGPS